MSDFLDFSGHRATSISASDGAPDVFGSLKSENVWQLDPEQDRTLLRLGCESEDSLEETRGRKSTIEVSEIYECEGSSFLTAALTRLDDRSSSWKR